MPLLFKKIVNRNNGAPSLFDRQASEAPMAAPYSRILDKARELAKEVRETAERVHQQALESRRLTEVARQQSERGRHLSRLGREEARAVKSAIKWSLDTAHKADCRRSGKDED
jgi:hypothetical protein